MPTGMHTSILSIYPLTHMHTHGKQPVVLTYSNACIADNGHAQLQ